MLHNLTPHDITFCKEDGTVVLVLRKSTLGVARLSESRVVVGMADDDIPIERAVYGDIENLPAAAPGHIYITSALVAARAMRGDVMSPGKAVRDTNGNIVGCIGLSAFAEAHRWVGWIKREDAQQYTQIPLWSDVTVDFVEGQWVSNDIDGHNGAVFPAHIVHLF